MIAAAVLTLVAALVGAAVVLWARERRRLQQAGEAMSDGNRREADERQVGGSLGDSDGFSDDERGRDGDIDDGHEGGRANALRMLEALEALSQEAEGLERGDGDGHDGIPQSLRGLLEQLQDGGPGAEAAVSVNR